MLLDIDNPKVDISKATNVYAMYTWISKHNGEPQADLLRMFTNPSESIAETIKEVQSKPQILLRGVTAKLYKIYVDRQ